MIALENYQEAVALFAVTLKSQLSERLRSVMVYGSCAVGGPFWTGSDIDSIVIANEDDSVDVTYLNRVAAAREVIAQQYGEFPYTMVGRWDELRLILNPITQKYIVDNGVCIAGQDMRAVISEECRGFPPHEFQRGALRILLFERYNLRESFLKFMEVAPRGDFSSLSQLKGIWKCYLDMTKFSVWLHSPIDQPLPGGLEQIFDRFELVFPDFPQDMLPRNVFSLMQSEQSPEMEFTEKIVLAGDLLAKTCVDYFSHAIGKEIPFIDPM